MAYVTLTSINAATNKAVEDADKAAQTELAKADYSTAGMLKMQYNMQDLALKSNLQSTLVKTVYDLAKGILQKFP